MLAREVVLTLVTVTLNEAKHLGALVVGHAFTVTSSIMMCACRRFERIDTL